MRVLFVDDDQNVLSALNRSLKQNKVDWEIGFSNSGHMALDEMQQQPYDVVVSDMMMPQMSGEEFLGQVIEHHPQSARIILSGECDQANAYKLVGADHLYLAKPCPIDLLIFTVQKAYELYIQNQVQQTQIIDQHLQDRVDKLEGGMKDFLSILLMKNIVSLEDIPPSLHYLVSQSLIDCYSTQPPHSRLNSRNALI